MKTRNGYHSEQTRNESYKEVLADEKYLSDSQRKVFEKISATGSTMREISEATGMEIHLVSARMSELRQKEFIIDTPEKRISKVTGKPNTIIKINPRLTEPKQLTLL